MDRKLLAVLLSGLLTAQALSAKGARDNAAQRPGGGQGITVRLLTDATGIDDKSFNAAAWRGILEFYGDTWENPRMGRDHKTAFVQAWAICFLCPRC
jgi:basic membrane protein A